MSAEPGAYEGLVLADTYRVGRLLGHGGMGRVHLATHLRLPKRFAVKFLEPRLARDALSYARFRREAEIASSLGNPHIAHVLDFNTLEDGSPYMIMELLEGEDLADRLSYGALTTGEVLRLSEHLASALTEAHQRGVIHRDIKPENIFLCTAGEDQPFVAKILDFGISKLHGTIKNLTAAGALLGTPAYMSPEQAGGVTQLIDHRSDIYSMAAVLYEALSGHPVYGGDNAYEILTRIATTEPAPIPGMPPEVDAALQRGLARNPGDRPGSAAELHRDLERALLGDGVHLPVAVAVDREPVAPRVDPIAMTDVAGADGAHGGDSQAGDAHRPSRSRPALRKVRASPTWRYGRIGIGLGLLAALIGGWFGMAPGPHDATAGPSTDRSMPSWAQDPPVAAPPTLTAPESPPVAASAAAVPATRAKSTRPARKPTARTAGPRPRLAERAQARATAARTPPPAQPADLLVGGKEL